MPADPPDDAPPPSARTATVTIAFRAPEALAHRLDKLAADLSTGWRKVKRSELARAALERGLAELEREAASRPRDT
jgi:predicted transcriptional regulator